MSERPIATSNRHPRGWRFLFAALAFAALPASGPRAETRGGSHSTTSLPELHAADPSAAVVSARTLLASERFWPYQAALVRPWESLPKGALGVVIRIEPGERARLDFGRDGLFDLPVAATDLVERSNQVRSGALEKRAPNFLLAIGPRLLDSRSEGARAFPYEEAAASRLFLCVFADPWRKDFGGLAAALAPLVGRPGLQTILFPLSHRPDSQVSGQLRAMKWTQPFVYAHLSEPYVRSLLDPATPRPAVLLQTAEGRVLFQGRLDRDVVPELDSALRAAEAPRP